MDAGLTSVPFKTEDLQLRIRARIHELGNVASSDHVKFPIFLLSVFAGRAA